MWIVKNLKRGTIKIEPLPPSCYWLTTKECRFDKRGRLIGVTYRDAGEILKLQKIAEKTGYFDPEIHIQPSDLKDS